MKKCFVRIIFMMTLLSVQITFSADGFVEFAKSIGSAKFWEGMGSTFGAPPSGYTYSCEIYNDSNVQIYAAQEGVASFMGATFLSAKGIYNKKSLPSLLDATTGPSLKAVYHELDYYFNFYMSQSSDVKNSPIFAKPFVQLPFVQHDPNIFYYRIYMGKDYSKGTITHKPKVEMLGYLNPNGQGDAKGNITIDGQLSSLVLYNSSNNKVQVTLNYGTSPYKVTLEKNSYNTLNVPFDHNVDTPAPLFSLRPNTLAFSVYNEGSKSYQPFKNIQLSSDGFNGYTYTIETFDEGQGMNVCMQGLSMGCSDQIISPRIRDITPCPCNFWYQSVEQAGAGEGYVDLPGQVWIAYQGVDSMIISKVDVGTVVSWSLIRPLIDQRDQYVYFVYVVTNDDIKAKKFVGQIVNKTLGSDQVAFYDTVTQAPLGSDVATTIMTADQQNTALTGTLSVSNGLIEDKIQGVYGYILGMDIFTPKGLGLGNYYYVLSPSIINAANIVQSLSGCLNSSKLSAGASSSDIQKILTAVVKTWLQSYVASSQDTANQVQQYLIQYGNGTIVDTKGVLTTFGQSQLNSLLQGFVSLKYPPMKLSTVVNHFVYDFGKAAPDKMPTTTVPLPIVTQL